MLTTALLFPGQGSQRPGMLSGLPDHPQVAATLAEASHVLGRDWRAFDTAEALARTDGAQTALLVAGVATARAVLAEGGRIDLVCGHSIGAFAAAVAAEAASFEDMLEIVELRGRLMAESHPTGFGMTAVIGLREAEVSRIVEAARDAGPAFVSNRNAALQTVVSGADAALDRVAELALAAGARKAERLDVATPSHCLLVAGIADRLAEALGGVAVSAPSRTYVSARRARVIRDPAAIREDLARNVAEPVLWADAARLIGELGVRTALVAPPGGVLADLAAEALGEARVLALDGVAPAAAARLAR